MLSKILYLCKPRRVLPSVQLIGQRNFWAFLNIVWNRVDSNRIKEVGPDRACAEWLMKNGAFVKWENESDFLKNYDCLPPEDDRRHIVEVDATEASITHIGFAHFKNCNHIRKVKLDRCAYVDDRALQEIKYLADPLHQLYIIKCYNVTDKGVVSLKTLRNLKELHLSGLPYVKHGENCLTELKSVLPSCDFHFTDITMKPS